MRTPQSLLLFCAFGLNACPATNTGESGPDDIEMLKKVYDVSYYAPDTFYVDERSNTVGNYSLYHVMDPSVSYERCTDEYQLALDWESADNDRRSVSGSYAGSQQNDRFFEVVRELSYPDSVGNINEPISTGFSRIFKCSYANRDGVDRHLRNGYAGTLNTRPLSNEVLKTYTEYLWQFTFFWPTEKKVLHTISARTANTYQHTLKLAFRTNQGTDQCDLIEVVDWVFTVDRESGEIEKEFRLLYDMNARLVNGVPERC